MARQNIQFKGMRHSPSDITGQDGDLLECVNLIHENGELKPIEMPERMSMNGLDANDNVHTLVAVHNLTDADMYVFARYDGTDTYIIVKSKGAPSVVSFSHTIEGEEILWAETIGNTLIIGTDKSTHYALYKNGQYKWLGDKLPQPVFEFDFTRETDTDAGHYINEFEPNIYCLMKSGNSFDGGGIPLSTEDGGFFGYPSLSHPERPMYLANTTYENKKIFRDGIVARHAQVMSTSKRSNVFIYPFFIRYAIKMYDNQYSMHSAPILMIPSTLVDPILASIRIRTDGHGVQIAHVDELDGTTYGIASYGFDSMQFRGMNLQYKFKGFVDDEGVSLSDNDISDWNDIIKGVDLFMSSQIVSFYEKGWENLNNVPTEFYCFNRTIDDGEGGYIEAPGWKDYGSCYSLNHNIKWWDVFENFFDYNECFGDSRVDNGGDSATGFQLEHYVHYKIQLPQKSAFKIQEELKNTNLFYCVKQYELSDLKTSDWGDDYKRFASEAEEGILERLETLPTLPDDYVSRSRITGSVSYDYNQRLILGNIRLQAPMWYHDTKMFDDLANTMAFINIYFVIEKQEKTIVVEWSRTAEGSVGVGNYDFGHYLYYPDPDCKRAIVNFNDGSGTYTIEVPMHEHTGLHGAYALMPDLQSLKEANDSSTFPTETTPTPSDDRYYSMPNTIAMSSVANPFHFPSSNFKDIGRAKVIGIAANVLDVSYEQWGPYPLYAFCTDGIVAITIDKEGKFGGPVEAVSADVLLEHRGLSRPTLVQANKALVFLTQRGVMLLSDGSKPICVSLAMNGRHFNALVDLLPANSVLYNTGLFSSLVTDTSDDIPFRNFVESGFLAYDYAHNRVLLMQGNNPYQYVYSIETGLWSKEIIYLSAYQIDVMPDNTQPDEREGVPLLDVIPIEGAVNDYTEMFLQDSDGYLYRTMQVTEENNMNQYYKYGYFVSRPVRFGTDEYKTIVRALHRYTHYANMSFVRWAVYGSRDGVNYGRINTLRGMSYQYFIFVVYTYLKPNERYSYLTVDFEPRLTNKLR